MTVAQLKSRLTLLKIDIAKINNQIYLIKRGVTSLPITHIEELDGLHKDDTIPESTVEKVLKWAADD